MFSQTQTTQSTKGFFKQAAQLAECIVQSDAVMVGAGAGLSAAAGFTYDGKRFEEHFSDFIQKYGFSDMYSAGFYPYETPEEFWAYWSRYININRYTPVIGRPYEDLLAIVRGRDYFVLTTNVDHRFQLAGFDKHRLFYTQGDYGLWQCARPCHYKTYDNENTVKKMVAAQKDMRIPSELVPHCPLCGAPMSMNLRSDDTFVEDEGWHAACGRYEDFIRRHKGLHMLFLELGVGANTPGIIKYPFWQMTMHSPGALYACVNLGEASCPAAIRRQSICINQDIAAVLQAVREALGV